MARAPKKLRITQGTDEANDGTNRYPVERDGTVTVPADVAERLLHGGGFVEIVEASPPPPVGMVRLSHPTAAGCSWGGLSFKANDAGHFLVPISAEPDLAAHGFERVPDEPTEAEAVAAAEEQEPVVEPEAEQDEPAAASEPEAEAEA